jgi:hypothetical protein
MKNELGADIPTAWLIIIPIANIYWLYKYADGFAKTVKKDNNGVLWFLLFFLVDIVRYAIVQIELNKLATGAAPAKAVVKPKAAAKPTAGKKLKA